MARVIGVGGVFFKSPDPGKLKAWYIQHLGFPADEDPGVSFSNKNLPDSAYVVWGPFAADTRYFDPADKAYMFNLVIDDLDDALQQVAGAEIVGEVEEYDFGRFGWFLDPDGNKVELWQPQSV